MLAIKKTGIKELGRDGILASTVVFKSCEDAMQVLHNKTSYIHRTLDRYPKGAYIIPIEVTILE